MLATLRTLAVSQYIKHPFNCAFMPKKRKLKFFWVPDELGSQIVLRICSDHWSFRKFRPIWVPKSLARDMAVQASLVWPKIDEIWEFAEFLYRFFSYHAVMGWNDREPLPAVPGSLTQHSGSLLSIFRVAGGPVCAYVKARFCDFQAIFRPFLLLSHCSAMEWLGTTSSKPRHPKTTFWVTFEYIRGGRGARMSLRESWILLFSSYFQTVSSPITL